MTEPNCQEQFNREASFCEYFASAHDVRVTGDTGDNAKGQVDDGRENYAFAERVYGAYDLKELL